MSNFCSKCGSPQADDANFCTVCGKSFVKVGVSYQVQPNYNQRSNTQDYIYPKANVGNRICASLLDTICSMIAYFGLLTFGMILAYIFSALGSSGGFAAFISSLGMIIAFIIAVVYPYVKDGIGRTGKYGFRPGQSYGKRICNTMVINVKTNQPCSIGESALRNLILCIPLLGFVDVIIGLASDDGRRIGDKVADTQVIDVANYKS